MLAVLALTILVVLFSPAQAQAYPNAAFHGLDTGNRGADVTAMQYLLVHHGHATDTDGVFDADTESAVRAFQSAESLAVDGLVGPQTWGALTLTLREGASSDAVKALQVQLNAKRRIELPVDGNFTSAVDDAVRSFQRHAGIGVDGIVGPITWRNLVWHFDYPDVTNICNQDPDGNSNADWATATAIGQLEEAALRFASSGQGQVPLGDIGFEHGGDIPGHGSHDVGLDVDLWPIRTDDAQCTAGRITWRYSTYDRAATRQLIEDIPASAGGHVALIFFNDPVLIDEGLTTHWPNHDNHLHVRYCELGGAYSC